LKLHQKDQVEEEKKLEITSNLLNERIKDLENENRNYETLFSDLHNKESELNYQIQSFEKEEFDLKAKKSGIQMNLPIIQLEYQVFKNQSKILVTKILN
jgi:peptidoglycan hydrolase CwlO-like protein